MSDIVIKAENLGKKYVIGHQAENGRYVALRDVLMQNARGLWHKTIDLVQGKPIILGDTMEEFWALKDVSFEIQRGEAVGIIGRNGAGKSTLLKILSRITEPSAGRVTIMGRVASLLEVGTGFHPELTGRENIYLNGAILGMARAEIKRKFDEIVAFAEVEKFLDTPVKRYSSGMYVRLAFAVAAHLEPEILVVDEVLAVGDLAFQKKCLGKMGDVATEGRTVLFVSHNMQSIRALCSRSILLDRGRVVSDAATPETLSLYNQLLRESKVDVHTATHDSLHRRGSGAVRFDSILISDADGNGSSTFEMGDTIRFSLTYKVMRDVQELLVCIALRSGLTGEIVTSAMHVISSDCLEAGTGGTVRIEFPDIYARPGEYPLYFWLGNSARQPFDVVDDLTGQLVIVAGPATESLEVVPGSQDGYFSIPSRMFAGPLNHGSDVHV
jgi:lipopolysaccharide transport system ATP-binding protein